jgi:hypothetical protein
VEVSPTTVLTPLDHHDRGPIADRLRRLAVDAGQVLQILAFPTAIRVALSRCWIVALPLAVSIGWMTDRLRLTLEIIGALLIVAVSLAALTIAGYSAAARFIGTAKNVSTAIIGSGSPASTVQLPEVIALSACWSGGHAAAVLTSFVDCFDSSLAVLRTRLADRLGEELGGTLPLHQQIAFAEELAIWSTSDVTLWRQCLRLRTAILAEGQDVAPATLARHADWLCSLTQRTQSSTLS